MKISIDCGKQSGPYSVIYNKKHGCRSEIGCQKQCKGRHKNGRNKALDECVTEYRDEDPEFYDGRVEFFEANNQ